MRDLEWISLDTQHHHERWHCLDLGWRLWHGLGWPECVCVLASDCSNTLSNSSS